DGAASATWGTLGGARIAAAVRHCADDDNDPRSTAKSSSQLPISRHVRKVARLPSSRYSQVKPEHDQKRADDSAKGLLSKPSEDARTERGTDDHRDGGSQYQRPHASDFAPFRREINRHSRAIDEQTDCRRCCDE